MLKIEHHISVAVKRICQLIFSKFALFVNEEDTKRFFNKIGIDIIDINITHKNRF